MYVWFSSRTTFHQFFWKQWNVHIARKQAEVFVPCHQILKILAIGLGRIWTSSSKSPFVSMWPSHAEPRFKKERTVEAASQSRKTAASEGDSSNILYFSILFGLECRFQNLSFSIIWIVNITSKYNNI